MRDPKDIVINGVQLSVILESHDKWRKDQEDGYRADLGGANLRGADLGGADLRGADLSGADLRDANLRDADLGGADLRCAKLRDANLRDAKLRGANNIEFAAALVTIVPEGDIIGWKKCNNRVIVKLLIPAEARRSNATGRKCRAEFAKVLEVFGAEYGVTTNDIVKRTEYRVGEIVRPDSWDENRWDECSHGIHFFITRIEAENY